MDDGKHESMKPIELYRSREEYYDNYPLTVFRTGRHIDQEERRRKMLAYYAEGIALPVLKYLGNFYVASKTFK
jgi:hypothetical protein